jgi:2-oxoglutarate ferredoxin oxidoreductase subunit delta
VKGKVKIDDTLCKGCKYCIISCPKEVLVLGDKFNRSGHYPAVAVQMEKCTGCALCAEVCPEIAIEVWRKNGSRNKKAKAGARQG